jgi:hypothetical protein
MHDCPRCAVPLHGHEEICPACGAKQHVRSEYSSLFTPKKPKQSPLPFVVGALIIVAGLVVAAQNSWIGQMMTHKPVDADPFSSMTPAAARQELEEKITANLAAIGGKGKLIWMANDKVVDRNFSQPVQLTIDAQLPNPKLRRSIVDPVKQLMNPGQVPTITMSDSRSHATWTYSVSPVAEEPSEPSN